MKIPTKPFSRKGFTLVELLVVIAIIAVLAAASFAIGPAMMNKAKKVSAQAGATSLATAVEQFYTEYSALPSASADPSEGAALSTAKGGTGVDLLRILAGEDLNDQNPRKIRFLSGKEAKNGRDGIVYSSNGNSIEAMTDPWGQPFFLKLDYNYDDRLEDVDPTKSGVNLNGRKVAVYSLGVQIPTDAKASTLVRSW